MIEPSEGNKQGRDFVHLLIKTGAGGHIDLTADDGLDARLFGRLVKLHTAVHHTVVGAGNGSLAAPVLIR